MLFAQRNGLEHALGDTSEVEVLQNLACQIGPRVDGINASRSIPQAMGAYVTAGAQGACIGRDQQSEQHTSTTMRLGLGADMAVAPAAPTQAPTPAPTTPSPKTAMISKLAMMTAAMAPRAMTVATEAQLAPPQAQPTPSTFPDAVTYPAGTITAFSASTNQWRIAVPRGTAGLGIFSAAADFVEVAPAAAPPASATQVPEKDLLAKTGQLPFYKKPLFWAAVAGGAVVVGTGSYFLLRHRKSA